MTNGLLILYMVEILRISSYIKNQKPIQLMIFEGFSNDTILMQIQSGLEKDINRYMFLTF
jgi:hypothetical protein